MADLNDWQLTYPGATLAFGTVDTGYPLTTQVEISSADVRNGDASHPSVDGTVFGLDSAGGMTLTFAVGIPKQVPTHLDNPGERWTLSLDAISRFKAAWGARELRRTPGAVAKLTNLSRDRLVYGRPRNLRPRLDKVRQGWSELLCDFATTDDLFYSATEESARLKVVPGTVGGFVLPAEFPWVTTATTERDDTVRNAGDEPTWAVLVFIGPSADPRATLLDNYGGVLWTLRLDGSLAYDETAVIDTRPWSRGARVNGGPASGRLRGTALDLCRIPPGLSTVRYDAVDNTGTSSFDLRWRHAYAGL